MIWSSLLLWSVLFTGPGCVSGDLEERLSEARDETSAQTLELAGMNQSGDVMVLDWNEAVKLLNERNLSLRQARSRLEQVRKNRDEQWKTWIPRPGINANLLSSLSEIGSIGTSNMSASVVAPLNIPNPLTERARAFANALDFLESQDSLVLSQRRMVISLYRLFSRYEALVKREGRMSEMEGGAESVSGALGVLERRAAHRDAVASLQGYLAQILNLPGKSPTPAYASRPKLGYEKRIHKLVPGKNYGELAVRLSAYQIEGALLREKGVQLSRWPTLWVGGSVPALYDTRQTGGNSFEADQINLFGGLSKSYDVTGAVAQSINTAKENTEFVRENLRLRLDQESREWIRMRDQYDQVLIKQKLAGERLRLIQRQDSGSAVSDLAALRGVRESLDAIESSKELLDLEIWVWDEKNWK